MPDWIPPGKVVPSGEGALPDCDRSSQAFLAAVLLRQVQAMLLEVEGVRQAVDIECIHRMRVASRRARNLLPLMAGCVGEKRLQNWAGQLRGITRALGAARDADVQIAAVAEFEAGLSEPRNRPGIRRLLLRLRQQRAGLQTRLLKVLARLEQEKALEKIEKQAAELLGNPAPEGPDAPLSGGNGLGEGSAPQADSQPASHLVYHRAAYFILRRLEEFLAYEPFIYDPANQLELHAMRISAKHLRYTLETFGPLYSDGLEGEIRLMRKIQESLGTIHDCDVWAAFLPAFLEEERERARAFYGHLRAYTPLLPGLKLFAEDRAALRQATYAEFLRLWEKSKRGASQGDWQALRRRIRLPLLPQQVFPPSTPEAADV